MPPELAQALAHGLRDSRAQPGRDGRARSMHGPETMGPASCTATVAERTRPLPGDSLVPDALLVSTHAITIDAPADQVWPWLVQMGGGRAGWYSWDRIDNGGVPSARHLDWQLQSIAPGDIMPAIPGATDGFLVAAVDPSRDLVLSVPGGAGGHLASWDHFLQPLGNGRTRLIARSRVSRDFFASAQHAGRPGQPLRFIERVYRLLGRLPRPVLLAAGELGHRFMEARHLRGIKQRAEPRPLDRLVERLQDRRGGRIVFLSHCLLDENTRYLGGACRPGCVGELVLQCMERGVGIVQMPCPEQQVWGGVLKRRMLQLYGAAPGGLRAVLLRRAIAPLAVVYTRLAFRRLARRIARQVEDAERSGVDVLGVVGVDGSPSCGLDRTIDIRAALPVLARIDRATISVEEMNGLVRSVVTPGTGIFIDELRRALFHRGCQVPFLAHDLLEELDARRSRVQLPVPPGVPAIHGGLHVEA